MALTPSYDASVHAARRARVLEALRAEGDRVVALLPNARVFPRNHDVEHPYRTGSDFAWLTGFDEPESVAVLATKGGAYELFARPRNPEREQWDGLRAGLEGAQARFGAAKARAIETLEEGLVELLADVDVVAWPFGRDTAFDAKVLAAIGKVRLKQRLKLDAPARLLDLAAVLHPMRWKKDAHELALMRRAAEITAEAHVAAMKAAAPGKHEYHLEAALVHAFREGGSRRDAYEPIVASGGNATILHYRENDRRLEAGDLVLIDAGCELDFYASDVTRTFPVSAAFSAEQAAIYDLVLAAQKAAFDAVKPGATLDHVHATSVRVLSAGLVELGIVKASVEECVAKELHKPFTVHRTSHWLGMDVHDCGAYYRRGEAVKLEPGCVLTVEPGLYFMPTDERVEAKWRGIGVRIEDDLLVTEAGYENLTAAIPKERAAVEALRAGSLAGS
jgi:Xaa-Pro aminopeptidase